MVQPFPCMMQPSTYCPGGFQSLTGEVHVTGAAGATGRGGSGCTVGIKGGFGVMYGGGGA